MIYSKKWGVVMKKHTVKEISGTAITNKTYVFVDAINHNAEVLVELAQYVDTLEKRVAELEKKGNGVDGN